METSLVKPEIERQNTQLPIPEKYFYLYDIDGNKKLKDGKPIILCTFNSFKPPYENKSIDEIESIIKEKGFIDGFCDLGDCYVVTEQKARWDHL